MATRTGLVSALLMSLVIADLAYAADMRLSASVSDVFQADWTPFPDGTAPVITTTHGIPLVAKVDLYLEIDQLLPEEMGFGNMAFNLFRYGDVEHIPYPIWSPDSSTIDSNGPAWGGVRRKWDDNMDIGPSTTDLRSVLVGILPGTLGPEGVDPRRTLGQHGPEYFGSLFVPWDGTTPARLFVSLDEFATYSPDLLFNLNASSDGLGTELIIGSRTPVFTVLDWNVNDWHSSLDMTETYRLDGIDVTVAMGEDVYSGHAHHQSIGDSMLSMFTEFKEEGQLALTSFDFSSQVTDVSFAITRINGYVGSEHGYVDEVTITGFADGQEVLPVLSGEDVVFLSDNTVVNLTPPDTETTIFGDVAVRFDEPVDRILVTLENGASVTLPGQRQRIAFGDVRFSAVNPNQVPAPSTAGLFAMGLFLAVIRVRRLRRRRTNGS